MKLPCLRLVDIEKIIILDENFLINNPKEVENEFHFV